jgi:hypothetical protein
MKLRNISVLCLAGFGIACLSGCGGDPDFAFPFGEATEIVFKVTYREEAEFSITDKQEIARLSKLMVLAESEPCACKHFQTVTFRQGAAEFVASICEHCCDIGRGHYDMPQPFYEAYQKLLAAHRAKAKAAKQEEEGVK